MEETIRRKVEIDLELDTEVKEKEPNKFKTIIDLAEAVDKWRIFPRLFIGLYLFVFYKFSMWIMLLENPTTQQASLFSVITGIGAAWFGTYVATGGKKSE